MYKRRFNQFYRWLNSVTPADRKWLSFYAAGACVSVVEISALLVIAKLFDYSFEGFALIAITVSAIVFHWVFMEKSLNK
jgi:uncharacterized membrane protein YbaN (DUF454 family)